LNAKKTYGFPLSVPYAFCNTVKKIKLPVGIIPTVSPGSQLLLLHDPCQKFLQLPPVVSPQQCKTGTAESYLLTASY